MSERVGDEKGFRGLTCSANIAAGAPDVYDTRLGLVGRRRGRGRGLLWRRSRGVGRVCDRWRGGCGMIKLGVGGVVLGVWAGEAAFLAVQPSGDAVVAGGKGGCDDDIHSQNRKGE